jgi:hypothetical protein
MKNYLFMSTLLLTDLTACPSPPVPMDAPPVVVFKAIPNAVNALNFDAATKLMVQATADGGIKSVEFLEGTQVLNVDTQAPFEFEITDFKVGQTKRTFKARVTSNVNLQSAEEVEVRIVDQAEGQISGMFFETGVVNNLLFLGQIAELKAIYSGSGAFSKQTKWKVELANESLDIGTLVAFPDESSVSNRIQLRPPNSVNPTKKSSALLVTATSVQDPTLSFKQLVVVEEKPINKSGSILLIGEKVDQVFQTAKTFPVHFSESGSISQGSFKLVKNTAVNPSVLLCLPQPLPTLTGRECIENGDGTFKGGRVQLTLGDPGEIELVFTNVLGVQTFRRVNIAKP